MTPTPDQQIDRLINQHEASWRLGYNVFPAVLNRLGLKRGAEIGVAFGGHSEAILQNTAIEKLYAIDSYLHRPEYDDPMNLPQPVFDRLFERTGERLRVFGSRAKQIRLDSVDAAKKITEPLDFVYIDGDHSYEGIRADLEAWFPLIREGGIIAGHDYGQPAFPGVKAAADHFFKRFGQTVTHEGKGIWWAKRPATDATFIVTTRPPHFCDAMFYQRLVQAGLTERDTIMLVHDEQGRCDAASRVLAAHPKVVMQSVANLRGPWHAATQVLDQVNTPLLLPIELDTPLAHSSIHTLRNRLCNSGAMAAACAPGPRTSTFDLTALLATNQPPVWPGQVMTMTTAIKRAHAEEPSQLNQASEQLIPWLVFTNALARGGRIAIEPSPNTSPSLDWTTEDCQRAAEVLCQHAPLIDGTDLIRLKWPTVANHWLNTLDRRPVRTRANVRPIDTPATYDTPRLLDRVVHKFRRSIKRVAA